MAKETISSAQEQENLRLALEITNQWHRHLDNFAWAISTLLLAGTGVAAGHAINMHGKDWKILPISIIMIVLWYWYLQYLKDVCLTVQFYLDRTNELERKLNIDALPDHADDVYKPKVLKEYHYGKFVIDNLKTLKYKKLPSLMIHISYLAYGLWSIFILEFVCNVLIQLNQFCFCAFNN